MQEKKEKRVLIISYNPLCLFNNGGKSLLSLFSSFSKEELIQFYIYPTLPDNEWCNSFYRQTDKDLLNPIRNKIILHCVIPSKTEPIEEQSIYKTSSQNRSIKLLCRDALWAFSNWDNKQLNNWIKENRPDIVFSDTGDSSFLYNVSLKISKKYNLPLVGYFGDDYCSIVEKKNLIRRYQLFKLRKTIAKFVQHAKLLLFVNDSFSDYYKDRFALGGKVRTIYNGSNFSFDSDYDETDSSNLVFSYIGNLSLQRGDNLIEIGKALQNYNDINNTSHSLIVYARNRDNFEERTRSIKAIDYRGLIPGNQVKDAIMSSDILIHTESFSEDSKKMTKYSMSTKIADSLSSGKCLLAFGPKDVASIKHLLKYDCAFCICSNLEMGEKLKQLIEDKKLRLYYKTRGKQISEEFHNSKKNSLLLKSYFSELFHQ